MSGFGHSGRSPFEARKEHERIGRQLAKESGEVFEDRADYWRRMGRAAESLLSPPPGMDKIVAREIPPGQLGWVKSDDKWWTHKNTGMRWFFPPGSKPVFLVPPWTDEADLREMARTGGFPG